MTDEPEKLDDAQLREAQKEAFMRRHEAYAAYMDACAACDRLHPDRLKDPLSQLWYLAGLVRPTRTT